MRLFLRYGGRFCAKWRQIFQRDRIRRYGIRLAVWDMAEFLGHRNFRSKVYHWIVQQKDHQVQRYLINHFEEIWDRFQTEPD